MRSALVDDVALCRAVKGGGGRVVFADGDRMADCRMYGSAAAAGRASRKNFYEGIGGRPFGMLVVMAPAPVDLRGALHWHCRSPLCRGIRVAAAAAVGVAANLGTRLIMAARYGHSLLSVLLHPVAVLAMMGVLA